MNAIIDDMTSSNINTALQENLLDLFESAMKSVASTMVREAKFDTTDFATAKMRGCEGFTLLVSRARADSRDGWFGAFQRGDERLDVVGHLEREATPEHANREDLADTTQRSLRK
jgi:hypothetical protein